MKYINMLLLSLIALGLYAQQQTEPKKFSLQEAVSYAKKYNNTLKNNELEVLAAEKKVKEVLSAGLPNVSASGTFNNYITVPSNVIDFGGVRQVIQFGVPYSATGTIQASQLLFDGGFLMGVKASNQYVNLAKINLKRGEVETEIAVSKAYFSALLVQTNIALTNANLDVLAKTKYDQEKTAQSGLIDRIDFDRTALQYSTTELQRDKLIDQSKVLLMLLKLQMGLNVNDNIVLSDSLEQLYSGNQVQAFPAKVDYNNRPEYQAINQNIALQKLDKKRYQLGYAPNLSAFFNHQESSFGSSFSELGKQWYPGTLWGLTLNIPIFDGLKKSSQIQQSEINVRKAENDKLFLENSIEQEVFNSKMSYERAGSQLNIQKKNFELAQQIYNRTQIKYNNGIGSSLEMANAQKDLETARIDYLKNIYDFFVAQLELRKALGDLNK